MTERLDHITELLRHSGQIHSDDAHWLITNLRAALAKNPEVILLREILQKVNHMTKNLDAIAKDWPTLRDAITSRLGDDAKTIADQASQITTLTAELKDTDPDDDRASEIDGEINDLLAKIKGTAQSSSQVVASTPAPASDSTSGGASASGGSSPAGTQTAAPSGTVTGGTGGQVSG